MLNDSSHFIARSPRHSATGAAALRISFQHLAGQQLDSVEVELIDLSRSGIQFCTSAALIDGQRIRIVMEDVATRFQSEQDAIVRWQRSAGERLWLSGCQFVTELSWEVLGELFLNDSLSRDVLSPPDA